MEERWEIVEGFPDYKVSNFGRVKNRHTDQTLALRVNNRDILYVGMVADGSQFNRSVVRLVATAFLPPPESDVFDTPIHLDGDHSNLREDNLLWRPRWFARQYHAQFKVKQRSLLQPVEDVATEERFETTWEAAKTFGLLHRKLIIATLGYTPVWPTNQRFRLVHPDIN